MRVVGIIAEYNPFHNGHLYQIKYAKEKLNADAVIVVMSGDFVQRGEPAILDKYTRSKMALINGVDLVLQMPVTASTASAEIFAKTGIAMLLATGVVTNLVFGCEEENETVFYEVAKLLADESDEFKDALSEALKAGDSFAKARATAILKTYKGSYPKERLEAFLNGSNNILGIEYTKALLENGADIPIHPIKRYGTHHDSLHPTEKYASATLLRKSMITKEDVSDMVSRYVPKNCLAEIVLAVDNGCFLEANDISLLLHEGLIFGTEEAEIADITKDLWDRILNHRNEFVSYTEFCDLLKTKNMNHSRIRRALIHLVLHITEKDMQGLKDCGYLPYVRVLGFNETGARLLKEIKANTKVPLFVSPSEVKNSLSGVALNLWKKDLYAADLYRILLTSKTGRTFPTEFTYRFEKTE